MGARVGTKKGANRGAKRGARGEDSQQRQRAGEMGADGGMRLAGGMGAGNHLVFASAVCAFSRE